MTTDYALFIVNVPNDQYTDADTSKLQSVRPSLCASLEAYLTDKIDIAPVWIVSKDHTQYQVTFYAEFGVVSDRILRDLNKLEIGIKNGSQICVVPATLIISAQRAKSILNTTTNKNNIVDNSTIPNGFTLNSAESTMTKRKFYQQIDISNFKKSVRARLMVHQVVAGIRAATTLSFDFIVLLSLASMLAAFGLLENSSVIIVASMLVSPLMNPIMGIVFGLSIHDDYLWKSGVRNELIGLLLCIVLGFTIGQVNDSFVY
ncbi:unnamed protein product [Rotaria sp. Silwood2]|nr:unnamed protein product [Rotaria sp. Silwood2]CAF4535759.1 unnamed protein product [Rotaria sp. Silwood2]